MQILFTLFKNDLKIFLRDWKAIILLLVTPIIFIGFFILALSPYLQKSNLIDPFNIALVDNENSPQTKIITRQLKDIKIFKEILQVNETKANELILQDKIAAIIIIPESFTNNISSEEKRLITVIGNKSFPLQSFVVKTLVQSAANLYSSAKTSLNGISYFSKKYNLSNNNDKKLVMDITMKALGRNEIYAENHDLPIYNLTPAEYFTSALIVVFLMFCGIPAMKMLVVERSIGITKRLISAPVKVWQIIISKVLISILLSILQFSIIIIFTLLIFKNYWGAPMMSILLLFVSIIFSVSTLSILISSICKTSATADVIGNMGILLMAVIGGSIYPLSSMPDLVRKLSYMTINRWSMEGFMIIFSGDTTLNLMNCITTLCIIAVAQLMLSIGIYKFSTQ